MRFTDHACVCLHLRWRVRVGVGFVHQEGGFPIKVGPNHEALIGSEPREAREFDGRHYVMEHAITGDYALVKAQVADTRGNLRFNKTARNFNPEMAKAGRITIAEVEEIVEAGELDPGMLFSLVWLLFVWLLKLLGTLHFGTCGVLTRSHAAVSR